VGRHSAPDEDENGDVLVTSAVVIDAPHRGRHARSDDDEAAAPGGPPGTPLNFVAVVGHTPPRPAPASGDSEPTVELEIARDADGTAARGPDTAADRGPGATVDQERTVELGTHVAAPKPAGRIGKGNQSTAADLALLRSRSDVRARVIAAVVAPFVIYTLAMYLSGALDVYFIWIWLPLVTAGVLAGSILDAAHRKREKQSGGS
jgi:hypothetical protein